MLNMKLLTITLVMAISMTMLDAAMEKEDLAANLDVKDEDKVDDLDLYGDQAADLDGKDEDEADLDEKDGVYLDDLIANDAMDVASLKKFAMTPTCRVGCKLLGYPKGRCGKKVWYPNPICGGRRRKCQCSK